MGLGDASYDQPDKLSELNERMSDPCNFGHQKHKEGSRRMSRCRDCEIWNLGEQCFVRQAFQKSSLSLGLMIAIECGRPFCKDSGKYSSSRRS